MISPSINYCQHIENLCSMNCTEIKKYIHELPTDLVSE